MSDPTATPKPAPTPDELQTLYRRAEKVWLERLVSTGQSGCPSVAESKTVAEVLALLAQARRG